MYTAAWHRLLPFWAWPWLWVANWRGRRKIAAAFPLTTTCWALGDGPTADERWGACELAASASSRSSSDDAGFPCLARMAAVRPLRRRVAVEEPPSLWHCPASGTAPDRPQGTAPSSRTHSSRLWHSPGLPVCAASPRSSCRDDRTPSCRRQARSLASRAAEAWRKPSPAEQLWWPWAWRPVWS